MVKLTPPPEGVEDRLVYDYLFQLQEYLSVTMQRMEEQGQEEAVRDVEPSGVVDQGTSGIWTYRKWDSGVAECWGYDTVTETLQNVSGGMYYGAAHHAAFPVGMFTGSHGGKSGLQDCQISVDGNALLWYGGGSTHERTQTYYLANPQKVETQTTFYVYYHAVGWWK